MSSDTAALAASSSGDAGRDLDLPLVEVPFFSRVPEPGVIWTRMLMILWVILLYNAWDALTVLLMEYWYLESFQLQSVFWTNFSMGVTLFLIASVAYAVAIIGPAFFHDVQPWARQATIHVGLMISLIAGYYLALQYQNFLPLSGNTPFGKTDPVFGNDIGFYVFTLPAIWSAWWVALWCIVAGLVSSLRCASVDQSSGGRFSGLNWFSSYVRRIATPCTLFFLGALGVLLAGGQWLARYDLLYKENMDQMIYAGAQYLDVTGVFSTLNNYQMTAVVILGVTVAIIFAFLVLRRYESGVDSRGRLMIRRAVQAIAVLVIVDFGFQLAVSVRDVVVIDPNEPLNQLEYIQHHIDATLDAYALNDVEVVEFIPNGDDDPLPDAREIMNLAAFKNMPLWPGYVAYLENHIDPQHAERILQTGGDPMVYGPTKELFRQEQKLTMYYDILNVDADRYKNSAHGGEKEMLVTALRELPLHDPQPWLYQWGQRSLWYTHGYGMIAAWASKVSPAGTPSYAVREMPPKSTIPELETKNHYVYFGEGTATMFFSNLKDMRELGHPTDSGPAEAEFPPDVESGVKMDSFLKRLVIGWRSDEVNYPLRFWEILFSDMITDQTRCHYWRSPIDRLEAVAPFLYFDTNIWPVVANGEIVWMVNGMTTTNHYPYSQRRVLGDKATVRTKFPRPQRMHNYVRDAVKCTVDATTGRINLYKFADEPIIDTWAGIYPDLFVDRAEMPPQVREHLQYPVQMFHRQFDDIYKTYHMTDPLVFFNMEDEWDDCDEVLGPVLDSGEAITFSFEPYHWIADTGDGVMPASSETTQFTMTMPFTPEKSLNLRAMGMVYQDGEDYGKLFCLQVPKGAYRMSPEQADAAIDQEPNISEQISWWNRLGTNVIHGHTTAVVAGGEVIYVAPIFIRSQQEPLTQLKKVCVVFRGKAKMGNTLEEALAGAIEVARLSQTDHSEEVADAQGITPPTLARD